MVLQMQAGPTAAAAMSRPAGCLLLALAILASAALAVWGVATGPAPGG
jgi:hypothetical protein